MKRKIKKVALIYPNQRWLKEDLTTTWNLTPYTIALLGTMIKELVEVKIIDAQFYNLSEEDFKKELTDFKPDMCGCSFLSTEYAANVGITVNLINEVDPEIVIVAGGVHITMMHHKVMNDVPRLDWCVRGEGEYVLPALINYLNGNGDLPQKGLVYRDPSGKIVAQHGAVVDDLDALPYPDYNLMRLEDYVSSLPRYGIDSPRVYPHVRFPTTRGCPIGCSFCQVEAISGAKIRMRSAKNVIDELEILQQKYGVKSFNFEDDNAFFHRKRSKELLQLMIDRKLDLKWKATGVFVPASDEEMYELMAKSGCEMINIAIESGSPRILKEVIRKPIDLEKVPFRVAEAQKHGLYVAANFIIGSPGETWDEIRETFRYAESCGVDYAKFFLAIPLIGTRMMDQALQLDWIEGDPYKLDQRYSVMKGKDYNPKDLSILRVYEWDRINFSTLEKRKKTAAMMSKTLDELDELRKQTRDALKLVFENQNE